MEFKHLRTGVIALIFVLFGGMINAQNNELTSMLTKELGISEKQAIGGAGALFGMASENLEKDEFSKIKNNVPGIENMMKAGDINLDTGALSGIGNATKNLQGINKVNEVFKKLGLNPKMVQKFTPIMMDFVKIKGGSSVAKLLGKGLNL
ncbi:MAG: DUF2780 domain-containing protein [Bacteroidota bacterium]